MAMRPLAPNDAKVWLKRLVKELGQKRIAVIAARAFANPDVIPFLIDQMKVPKLARVAGASFSLITGSNISYEDLDSEKPEGFEAGPTENPEDEKVAMDGDLSLPWPDPALIQKWWNARKRRTDGSQAIRRLRHRPSPGTACLRRSAWFFVLLLLAHQRGGIHDHGVAAFDPLRDLDELVV